MDDQLLVVVSQPLPGTEAQYHEWYQNVHIPEALSIPGFTSARRYERAWDDPEQPDGLGARYLALYAIDGRVEDAMANLLRFREDGRLTPMIDAVERPTLRRVPFRAITDVIPG